MAGRQFVDAAAEHPDHRAGQSLTLRIVDLPKRAKQRLVIVEPQVRSHFDQRRQARRVSGQEMPRVRFRHQAEKEQTLGELLQRIAQQRRAKIAAIFQEAGVSIEIRPTAEEQRLREMIVQENDHRLRAHSVPNSDK